jgi:ATP-dependent Zn protease
MASIEKSSDGGQENDLIDSAYHEAGHTLMSVLLDLAPDPEYVTILTANPQMTFQDGKFPARNVRQRQALLMVTLASMGAVHLRNNPEFDPNFNYDLYENNALFKGDIRQANECIDSLIMGRNLFAQVTGRARRAYLREAAASAYHLLYMNRDKLDALANTLCILELLNEDRIREIVRVPKREILEPGF